MSLQFVYCINVFILARLSLTFTDQGIKVKQLMMISAIQIISLLIFQNFWIVVVLAVVILSLNFLNFFFERKKPTYINEIRLIMFFSQVAAFSIFCAPWIGLQFNSDITDMLRGLGEYSLLLSFMNKVDWLNSNVIIMGTLLVLNESNLLIRSMFRVFRVFPGTTEEAPLPKIDDHEYNAGRIIGILERIIIYFAILYNELTVIGFLMAAKGFTRFKEMDNRNFAEYILIGTLLSTLVGIFVGLVVRYLIG